MAFLPIPNGQIHDEVSGDGCPLPLFTPGFLSSRIERWRSNAVRPGAPQDGLDPIAALSDHFRVIAFDVGNAGESRATLSATDDSRKGLALRGTAMRRVREFLIANEPASAGASR